MSDLILNYLPEIFFAFGLCAIVAMSIHAVIWERNFKAQCKADCRAFWSTGATVTLTEKSWEPGNYYYLWEKNGYQASMSGFGTPDFHGHYVG